MHRTITISSLILSFLSAATINVPDDYGTIQAGINASNDGDTVLVSQGNYVENLILEKEIVLASHAINDDLTDWMNNENIHNTKIIGNEPMNPKKGSCLQISYGNIEPTILGFTLQDGLGTSMIEVDCGTFPVRSGGAILIYEAYPTIMYNRFKNNGTSQIGGGNTAQAHIQNGGAIGIYDDDDVEFDEDRENYGNIDFADMDKVDAYVLEKNLRTNDSNSNRDRPSAMVVQNNYFENNSSGNGENIYSHGYDGEINVSGSVFENIDCENNTVNEFVLQSIEDEATFVQDNISGACIEENSFYVSSNDGYDSNDGTEEAPLKTIGHALTLVKDAEIPTTILLNAGVYSPTINGEKFPIVLPDNVHLIGEESENTILDAEANPENEAPVMIIKVVENVRVANLTLTGGSSESYGCTGGGGIQVSYEGIPLDVIGDTSGWRALTYPVIENVILEENHAFNGGGMSFFRVEGPVLNNVIIRNNTAAYRGGGIFSLGSTMTMTDVTITGNECFELNGGGMMLAASDGVYDNLTITNNSCGTHGGGIWTNYSGGPESYDDGWTLKNSTISGNTSARHGGGIAFAWSHPTVINCTISDNTALWGGGGIMGITSGFTLKESIVSNNYATSSGGGIRASGPVYDGLEPPIIEDCIVNGNETAEESGGILLYNGQVKRTVVFDNHAATYTGGVGIKAFATLTNLTISGNTASQGGGIEAWGDAHPEVINSIIWDNTPTAVSLFGTGEIDITYSDIDGGWDGEGNIDDDPLFTDVNSGDYTITEGSPCKNAGTTDTDGDGEDDITEYNGSAPDMGAFEITLPAISGFTFYTFDTYISLTWNPANEDGFQYYLLERSTDEEFAENIVSNYVTINNYEDDQMEYDTEYFYRVSYYTNNWSEYSEVISVTLEWMDVDGEHLPTVYALHQNYPNPFNPITTVRYELPEDSFVDVTVYDMLGNVVNNLVNTDQSSGYKSIQWDATNNQGEPVSAGVYLYKIQAGDFVDTKKMILLK
tara:strand:+ start:1015 stop:4017 length:3003 start_codon:yes stop_codon:yes gene_type:complete